MNKDSPNNITLDTLIKTDLGVDLYKTNLERLFEELHEDDELIEEILRNG